jgi:predicted transcriptional regulator
MDSDTRKRIKALVAANPGIHFSRIKGMLGMSPRTIRDQLRLLEKFGHVTAMDVDGKRSYVVPGSIPAAASSEHSAIRVLAFMQRGGREAVVDALLSSPGTRFTQLCDAVGEPRSNVRRKVEAMEARGYVIVDRAGREMVSIRLAQSVVAIVRQARDPIVLA